MDLEGIESGNPKFTKIIVRAINSCPIFLFMLSEASQRSENALKELDFAYDKYHEEGKKVVIVYIEPCKMNDEFKFDYLKADTIDWQNPLQREKLIRDLKAWTNYEAKLAKTNQEKEQLALAEAEAQRQAEEARKKREEETLRKTEAEQKRKEEQQKREEQRVALFSSIITLFRQNFMKKSTIWWVSGGMITILIIVFCLRLDKGNNQNVEHPSINVALSDSSKTSSNVGMSEVTTSQKKDTITLNNVEHPSKKVALSDSSKTSSNVGISKVTTSQKKGTITLNNLEHSSKKVALSDSSKTDTVSTKKILFLGKWKAIERDSESINKSNADIWLEAVKSQMEYENNEEFETLKNWELEKEKASEKLKKINAQLKSYKELVSGDSVETAPTFRLR